MIKKLAELAKEEGVVFNYCIGPDNAMSITVFGKVRDFIIINPSSFSDDEITEITVEELNHALDIVTAYFVEHRINGLVLDINERNKILAPAKEMTIDEIEKELGYKIKIVKEKK